MSAVLISGMLFTANAQEGGLEIRGGFSNMTSVLKVGGAKGSGSASGFHVGGVFSKINEGKGVELGLLFQNFSEEGYSTQFLSVPVTPKFYLNEKINLVGGAQFDFDLSDSFSKSTNIALGIGGGIDLGALALSARYFWGVKNMIDGGDSDYKLSLNTLQISAGFKL